VLNSFGMKFINFILLVSVTIAATKTVSGKRFHSLAVSCKIIRFHLSNEAVCLIIMHSSVPAYARYGLFETKFSPY